MLIQYAGRASRGTLFAGGVNRLGANENWAVDRRRSFRLCVARPTIERAE